MDHVASTDTAKPTTDHLLSEGCARNAPIELLYEANDGVIIVARSRLLDLTADHLLADKPNYDETDLVIPPGRPVSVHFTLRGARYQFRSQIEEGSIKIRLGAGCTLPGVALRRPTQITESQRRAHVRVSTVGYEGMGVCLARSYPQTRDACLLDPAPVVARLVNLSVGGLSLLVDKGSMRSVTPGECFFMTFNLPTVEEPFYMYGTVRHVRYVASSESQRLAFAFRPWGDQRFKRSRRRIAHFVADHQRRMLRRKTRNY